MAIKVNIVTFNLYRQFRKIPDPCNTGNTRLRFDDIRMAVFCEFFMQSSSSPDHQRKLHERHNTGVCRNNFIT